MSLFTVLNNNKNYKNGGAYWNRGTYLQKHILWGALIRKGALIGRRALNRIIAVCTCMQEWSLFLSRMGKTNFHLTNYFKKERDGKQSCKQGE